MQSRRQSPEQQVPRPCLPLPLLGQARAGYTGIAAGALRLPSVGGAGARWGQRECELSQPGNSSYFQAAGAQKRATQEGQTGRVGPPGQSCSPESEKQSCAQKSMPSVVWGSFLKSQLESSQCSGQDCLMGNAPLGASESQPHPASHAHNHLCKEEGNLQALIRKTELLCFPPDHLIFFIQFLRTQLLKEIK